jgi:hypothetical protein
MFDYTTSFMFVKVSFKDTIDGYAGTTYAD